MSGPKVVRVVTKQEVMSICRGRIDAFQDTIEHWRKCASRYDVLSAEEEQTVEKRLLAVKTMYEREQFVEVQKQCSVEIAFLQADMNRIQDEAIAKAEQQRHMRRRLQYSAETLISTFTSLQRQIPKELLSIASSSLAATDEELAKMNAILSQILTDYTMSSAEQEDMTPVQKKLSKMLSEGEKLQTLADWKSQCEDAQILDKDHRLDRLIAELEATEDKLSVTPFLDRIASISRESSASRRSLLTDSLILDLVDRSNERKAKAQAIASMRDIRSELHRFNSKQAKDLEALLTKAIDSEDISSSQQLYDHGISLIKEETKGIAGEFRRKAILKGLSELGYEIREHMATAWAENGRIIVTKPNENGYGIELGAIEGAERMQVQLVSFDLCNAASKASQDRDRETIWCSEFSRLQFLLEKAGTSLHIEKALPVGAKPLKQVQQDKQQGQDRMGRIIKKEKTGWGG
jgi:hypothetical protein